MISHIVISDEKLKHSRVLSVSCPEPNAVFPAGENTSDTDDLLMWATCVEGQRWKMSRVHI